MFACVPLDDNSPVSPLPQSLANHHSTFVPTALTLSVLHRSGIMWHLYFCDWLRSLSIMSPKYFHILACVRSSCLLRLSNIPLGYRPPCVYPFLMDECLWCFQLSTFQVAGRVLWMEESGRLQSMWSQRVRHDWAILIFNFQLLWILLLWPWVYKYLFENLFSFLLGVLAEVELLDYCKLCLTLEKPPYVIQSRCTIWHAQELISRI